MILSSSATELIHDCEVPRNAADEAPLVVEVLNDFAAIRRRMQAVDSKVFVDARCNDVRWLEAVCTGLRHRPYLIIASRQEAIVGVLPLALVQSLLFGRFLVSLPYVNTAGVSAVDALVAKTLIDRAVCLADALNVQHLELRHEREVEHDRLSVTLKSKVHMRLPLPATSEQLWDGLKSKVRNKVKKGDRQGFTLAWGEEDLLQEFYEVFSHTMRDLGTPVFGRNLFRAILASFRGEAELCVVRDASKPIAGALLVHGKGSTIVPSAASLHAFNSTNVNDWMYWRLLTRAIERGQAAFDFGRCTPGGNTFAFKKKWGAEPEPAVWQYCVRKGDVGAVRLEGGKYDRAVNVWRRLPLSLTRVVGPLVVRGIP